MKKFAIATIVAIAAIAIVALTVSVDRGSRAQKKTAPTSDQATAQANGRILESEIEVKELKCENELIGKTSAPDAHEFCNGLRRNDWEQWALEYPELAKARKAVAR
jgi:hypothetical protein